MNNNNAIQQMPTQQAVSMKSYLETPDISRRIGEKLIKTVDSKLFINSLIDLCADDTKLQQCDKSLLLNNAIKVANMGLSLVKAMGDAYLVPFGNVPTLIIGYMGWLRLAINSGVYKYINADVIYEGEFVGYNKITSEIMLRDCDADKRGNVKGYFATFKAVNPITKVEYEHTEYMGIKEMCMYAKRYSKGIRQNTTPEMLEQKANSPYTSNGVGWEADFNAMAKKTVLKRLITKWGIITREIQEAVREETIETEAPKERARETIEFEEVDASGEVQTPVQPQQPQAKLEAPF